MGVRWPKLYRYNGRWWHGGWNVWGDAENGGHLAKEFLWLLRHGAFHACWQWPKREYLIFGIGRDWYDGPIWFIHAGFFSVDLSPE